MRCWIDGCRSTDSMNCRHSRFVHCAPRFERARRRAGESVRSACGARPWGPGALCCSLREGGCEDAAFAAERGKCTDVFSPVRRCAADCPSLRCAARRRNSLPDPPTRRLAGHAAALEWCGFKCTHAAAVSAKVRVGGWRRAFAQPRSAGLAARARSALRALTRRNCLSEASAARAASFATGPQDRASQGTLAQRGQAIEAPTAARPRLCSHPWSSADACCDGSTARVPLLLPVSR